MKKWWKSKMIWVNALTLIAGVIGYLAGHELIVNNVELVAMLIAIQGGVNVILRFVTWKSIEV